MLKTKGLKFYIEPHCKWRRPLRLAEAASTRFSVPTVCHTSGPISNQCFWDYSGCLIKCECPI